VSVAIAVSKDMHVMNYDRLAAFIQAIAASSSRRGFARVLTSVGLTSLASWPLAQTGAEAKKHGKKRKKNKREHAVPGPAGPAGATGQQGPAGPAGPAGPSGLRISGSSGEERAVTVVPGGETASAVACRADSVAVGGGYTLVTHNAATAATIIVVFSHAVANGWAVSARRTAAPPPMTRDTVTAEVVCLSTT
jgi:hypothetical protein